MREIHYYAIQVIELFVRSGAIHVDVGEFENIGLWGSGWSRTSVSPDRVYNLDFHNSYIYLANTHYRFLGRPLRCLYTG